MAESSERPSAEAKPLDLFVVELRHPSGNFIIENTLSNATEAQTVMDLMDAQFDDQAVKVYRLIDDTARFRALLQERINKSENGQIPDFLSFFMTE